LVTSAVEQWADEDEDEDEDDEEENVGRSQRHNTNKNNDDDDSYASHSRTISVDEDDAEDQNGNTSFAMSRSRSINFSDEPQASSHSSQESTNHTQRASRSSFLTDVDEFNGLMAQEGAPHLTDNNSSVRPLKKKYLDTLSLERVPLHDNDNDNEIEEETDGLLVGGGATPTKKRKRRRVTKSTCVSLSFRTITWLLVLVVFVLALLFGATVYEKRKSHLRGENNNNDASEQETSATTNTHGLDVHKKQDKTNHCHNNLAYRHDNKAGRNCAWVAEGDASQKCADERVLRNCPATCDPYCKGGGNYFVPEDRDDDLVRTEYPTEFPTNIPTLFPTELASFEDGVEEMEPTFLPTQLASFENDDA